MIRRLLVAALAAALLPVAASAQNMPGALIGGDGTVIFKYVPLAAGAMMLGQGASNDPLAKAMSGDCTIAGSGAITCLDTNGTAFGTAAVANTGTSGATVPVLSASNTHSGTLNTFTR